MRIIRWLCLSGLCGVLQLEAQSFYVPEAETAQRPTVARVDALIAAARRDGWAPQAKALRTAALQAYREGKMVAAESWFNLYAWAGVLGQTEGESAQRWVEAINTAKLGHANLETLRPDFERPLARAVSPKLLRWMLTTPSFSEEFFGLITRVDYLPAVLGILNTLHQAGPERFQAYAHLALAIAVVYDVSPPPMWPHGQVSAVALKRKLPDPLDAFGWWVRQDQEGKLWMSLKEQGADQLKFVVDAAAPFAELEWAQQLPKVSFDELGGVYFLVPYRMERIRLSQTSWPGATYHLTDILKTGGICVDRAYFAAEVGKARGVPTLLIYGAGNEAWHAWFGYADRARQWHLDEGRFAQLGFVTGLARDPQTWREISDHELLFLSEGFRHTDALRFSRLHERFASDLLAAGKIDDAIAAARRSVQFEPRHAEGWDVLYAATKAKNGDPREAEVVLREAVLALRQYPDMEAQYVGRVAASLRARGQTSEAEAELQHLTRKNEARRNDLVIEWDRQALEQAVRTQPLVEQIRVYNRIVATHGAGAGVNFYGRIVAYFVGHLRGLSHDAEARNAIDYARQVLQPQSGTQLAQELTKLEQLSEPASRTGNSRSTSP